MVSVIHSVNYYYFFSLSQHYIVLSILSDYAHCQYYLIIPSVQVSHDEHLISGSVGDLRAVLNGKVTPFSSTFQDYKKMLKSS